VIACRIAIGHSEFSEESLRTVGRPRGDWSLSLTNVPHSLPGVKLLASPKLRRAQFGRKFAPRLGFEFVSSGGKWYL
jgi:hypothetical protein